MAKRRDRAYRYYMMKKHKGDRDKFRYRCSCSYCTQGRTRYQVRAELDLQDQLMEAEVEEPDL